MRETEKLVKNSQKPQKEKVEIPYSDEELHIINSFKNNFSLKVTAKTGKKGAGKLVINYDSLSDLDTLLEIFDKNDNAE